MLTHVTLTGADESVDPFDLLDSLAGLPVEIGILWKGPEGEGGPRYPGLKWLTELGRAARSTSSEVGCPQLSLHLCGRAARTVYEGSGGQGIDRMLHVLGFPNSRRYQRFQLNLAVGPAHPGRLGGMHRSLSDMAYQLWVDRMGKIILQVKHPVHSARAFCTACFPSNTVAAYTSAGRNSGAVLFDASGGRGERPPRWPAPWGSFDCGYAGGISPDSLKADLDAIAAAQVTSTQRFWTDQETSLRKTTKRGADDGFDLSAAKRAGKIAATWKRTAYVRSREAKGA